MTMSRGGVRPPPVCADCSAPDPTWASVNRGVLICDECCSVHRSLGRHISIVKSLKKAQWSPSQQAMVYLLATSGANNIWEHTMLDPSQNRHSRKKPGPRDPLHPNKSDFIRAKYQFLSFINKQRDSEATSLDDVSKELHASVRTNNVETCLRLLSKGADPNYFYREKGNCPMHVAAHAGQTAQIELLAVYGADPGIKDANGRTPVNYANNEGLTDLAHRLVELQYELTDRLTFYICGRKPDHRSGQHFKIPQLGDHTADLTDLAKQAKKKLQDLQNHLFEELAMDVYDEVDRRENDSIWLSTHDHTSIVSERLTVPHLPVNRELSATRNQGRQKLALFNAREFATLVMDILYDARLRQTGMTQTPKTPDKLTGPTLLKGPQWKTLSALSDEEPLYDNVASDEDYSSIDSRSVRSMQLTDIPNHMVTQCGGVEVVEGPVMVEEFLHIRRALAESQARIQHLVQVKTDLEKHLSDMNSKMESLMRENQTLRIQRHSLMGETASVSAVAPSSGPHGKNSHPHPHPHSPPHHPHPHHPPHQPPVGEVGVTTLHGDLVRPSPLRATPVQGSQGRPTSMIEMRDSARHLPRSSPVSSSQLSGASSVSNVSMTTTGQDQMSSDLEDQLNGNVLKVIDDLPKDAHLSEAYDLPKPAYQPSKSVASRTSQPPQSSTAHGFQPPRVPGLEAPHPLPQELALVVTSDLYPPPPPQAAGFDQQPATVSGDPDAAAAAALAVHSYTPPQGAGSQAYSPPPPTAALSEEDVNQSQPGTSRTQEGGTTLLSQPGLPPQKSVSKEASTSSTDQDEDLPLPPPPPPSSPQVLDPPATPTPIPTNTTPTPCAARDDGDFPPDSASSGGSQSLGVETFPPLMTSPDHDTPNWAPSVGGDLLTSGPGICSSKETVPVALPPGSEGSAVSTESGGELPAPDVQPSKMDDRDSTSSQQPSPPGGERDVHGEGREPPEAGEGTGGAAVLPGATGAMPTQNEVVRKTEKVTKKIQELLQSLQEGNHNSFAPCSERIHEAVTDMAALFPETCPPGMVQETLAQLRESVERLREECHHWPPPPSPPPPPPPDHLHKTQQVIQFAFDIAKAAKKLVTLCHPRPLSSQP